MATDFRFAVGIRSARSRAQLQETAWRYEDLGFDVLNIPDHLGAPAPFPVLAAVAQSTSTIRLGTYVMNAAFYSPALLARDAAGVHALSDGRLDLGLGAGYVREEFEAAEIPFPSAGARVAHLEHVAEHLRRHHPEIPLLIAGSGDKVLTVAARHADIVGLTGTDRIDLVRSVAGERYADLVLDLAITAMPSDNSGVPDLSMTRRYAPGLSDEQLMTLPGVLSGTTRDVADRLRQLRAEYGISSFSIQSRDDVFFAKVIAELR
ncbi:TIGR03621 family F420-dependent LLM class oxidoreductase [Mycobacterium sp. ACS4331]|uniref:TIGR03621 family F420-dependent LLM class oxidoreductase n=1 Tax=Mycobacterium sp. ACS4331 TaxID=1834121 RepID=UPI0007FBD604|nr:TIGR03621 family F420-dependent LLM class oxidoreductase [Mycobacterium sp. ACS4331]OBF29667.1 F420-dependent oxidoreductase [Mycobacterium sp. ACS4331]